MNQSRNKLNANGSTTKSNSQIGTHVAQESVYKSSGHIPSSGIQGGSKVFKASGGYDGEKGINERFIDLNKASEGAPKISKLITGSVIKSTDFSKNQATGSIRLGDQSKVTTNAGSNIMGGAGNVSSHHSGRANQHGLGFKKSIDG